MKETTWEFGFHQHKDYYKAWKEFKENYKIKFVYNHKDAIWPWPKPKNI